MPRGEEQGATVHEGGLRRHTRAQIPLTGRTTVRSTARGAFRQLSESLRGSRSGSGKECRVSSPIPARIRRGVFGHQADGHLTCLFLPGVFLGALAALLSSVFRPLSIATYPSVIVSERQPPIFSC